MTHVAARHGYGDASVARVVEQAGVSRATFYEHFADKEACFLVTFERAAKRMEAALIRVEADYSPAQRAGELLDELLANMVREPDAARILLLEALAGGQEVRGAHERFMQTVEETFERWLAGPGENGFRLTIPGRAVMEGAGGVLLMRCFRGESTTVTDLRDDLLAWIYSYAVPEDAPRLTPADWRRLGAGLVQAVPMEGAGEGAERRLARRKGAVTAEQRRRILAAMGQLAGTKGYAATTVADIVKTGSVTRECFYELFRNKEDAFLAAQIGGLERTISLTAAGFFSGENWPTRVWGGLQALFASVAKQPDIVYLDVIESYVAGTAAMRRSFDNRMAYQLFFEDGYRQRPAAEDLPRLCSETIGSAIVGLTRWQVGEDRTERMLEALPQAAYLALAPFIGPAAAIAFVEAKAAAGAAPPTA